MIILKRRFIIYTTLLTILLSACNVSSFNSDVLEKYEVQNNVDEITQDDFVFRLVSEKKQYNKDEDIKLYGEIEYIGTMEEITIHHSSSAILFDMKEEARGYEIGFGVNDIGLTTTIKKGQPYREEYEKSGGYSPDTDPKDYVKFMETFLNSDGFPPGYYIVNGSTDFFIDSENQNRVTLEATVDFKVVE